MTNFYSTKKWDGNKDSKQQKEEQEQPCQSYLVASTQIEIRESALCACSLTLCGILVYY